MPFLFSSSHTQSPTSQSSGSSGGQYPKSIELSVLPEDKSRQILFCGLGLLSISLFLYLSKLCSLYTKRAWLNIALCLGIFYLTYLSYYLRAQSAELYQTLFYTGFFYHSVLYLRTSVHPTRRCARVHSTRNLILAFLYLGLCCLVKIVYILMVPGLFLGPLLILLKNKNSGATGDLVKVFGLATILEESKSDRAAG